MSSVGENRTDSRRQLVVSAIGVSVSSESVQTLLESGIAVRQDEATSIIEQQRGVDCLLVSESAYEEFATGRRRECSSIPPVILVLEQSAETALDPLDDDAVVEYVRTIDLCERPSLVARRIEVAVASTRKSDGSQTPQPSNEPTPTVTEQEFTNLRLLFEQTPDTILVHDEEGSILDVNQTAVDTLGYSRTELTSMEISDIEVGTDSEELLAAWNEPPTDEPITVEGQHRHADGTTHPVEVWVNHVAVEGESRFVAIARDVTERRQYEQKLETQRDNLQTLNQVVRHDIRNDLQLVGLYAELLEDHVDDEGQSHLWKLTDAVENAVDLTTTARELAEVMLTTTVDNQCVAIRRVLEEQLEEIRATYPDADLHTTGSIPAVDIVGNDMLDSVFRNLLKNAIQHNDTEDPAVVVTTELKEDALSVQILDDGPGVPEPQQTEIFGRGERGLESDGTGIGLYLVRSLVDSVGGDVWVEDAPSDVTVAGNGVVTLGGAAFTVELPLEA